jgi:signal transduction histidine kinase
VDVAIERTRATPHDGDGGGPPRDVVAIRVHDDGEGVRDEDLPHIFEPFFTTKPVGEGTGLGLSVAYGIVRDHGGWIDVSSSRDEGTTFTIMIPV